MKRALLALLLVLAARPALAEVGEIRAGETALHEVAIGAADARVVATLAWKDRATEWSLDVQSANGTRFTGSIPGLEIVKDAYFYRLTIDRRVEATLGFEGTWTIRLHCLATHRRRPVVPYTFTVDAGSAAGFAIALQGLDVVHRAGDLVRLEARVEARGGAEALVDSVIASIVPLEGGEPFEAALGDDGEDPDRKAGDGVFAARFAWSGAGRFRVVVAVAGRGPLGQALRSEEVREVSVRAARADVGRKHGE